MRYNSEDKTLETNYKNKWKHLIKDYELIKQKKHTKYRFVGPFFQEHHISRQLFNKIYRRYKTQGTDEALLPQKRGPRWRSRRPDVHLEAAVLAERSKGLNKFEICDILTQRYGNKVISPSGVYNITRREQMNKLRVAEKEEKRQIIKTKAGELGHVDCHYVGKDLVGKEGRQYYLVCVVDDYSRIAWAEVVEDLKSLTVMFSVMRSFNMLRVTYNIVFERILSDNGAEFSSPRKPHQHPFERMLMEIGIQHSYTKPYRPQTNGKAERFWRTLKEDLLESGFDSLEELRERLFEYLIYYNEIRPHQSLQGKSPLSFLKTTQNLSSNY